MKIIRISLSLLAVVLCVGFAPPSLRPVESDPKSIGSLTFSAITQAEWMLLEMPYPEGNKAILQMRIANKSDAPVWFPTFDSMNPVLTDAKGNKTSLGGGRDGTTVTPNIFILPGKDYCYSLSAITRKSRDGKSAELVIRDDTGMWFTAPIVLGEYHIGFHLQPAHLDSAGKSKLDAPLWAAEGDTGSVRFQIVSVKAREK